MSSRKKFENFLNVQGGVRRTPRVSREDLTASSKKNTRQMRKLRQTNELFFFNSPTEDENISKTSPPFTERTNVSTPPLPVVDLTSPQLETRKSGAHPRPRLSVKKEGTFVQEGSHEDKENVMDVPMPKTSSPCVVNKEAEMGKRKIVRARRNLRTKIRTCTDTPKVAQLETLKDETDQEKSSDAPQVIVKTLPSPISPSANSTVDQVQDHLHFNSSKEELYPSTRGGVEATKRRTYELEDSVTEVSLLKSLSRRDSARLSSLHLTESNTSGSVKGNRVTQRRRWDKSDKFSPIIFNHKPEPKIQTPVLRRSPRALSTKKLSSKVKIPNFAAIHKKAMERAENISDYKKRKDERARRLLSGLKPKSLQQNSGTKESRKHLSFTDERAKMLLTGLQQHSSTKDNKKQLRFAPNTSQKDKSPTFIPLPCTPLPKRRPVAESPVAPKTPSFKFTNFKAAFDFTKKSDQETNSHVTRNDKEFSKGFRNHFGFGVRPAAAKNVFESKIINVKKMVQHEQIKSVANKCKPVTNNAEKRRCAIKGVRSNRRFDLLMNMRKGK